MKIRLPFVSRRREAELVGIAVTLDATVASLLDRLAKSEAARELVRTRVVDELVTEIRLEWKAVAAEYGGRHLPGARERLRLEGVRTGLSWAERAARVVAERLADPTHLAPEVEAVLDAAAAKTAAEISS